MCAKSLKKSHITTLRAKRATFSFKLYILPIFSVKFQIFEKIVDDIFGLKIQMRHFLAIFEHRGYLVSHLKTLKAI